MQVASMERSRILVNLYFVYIGLLTLVLGMLMVRHSRDWIVSDWLINYEGGFVRRGLPGEAALLIARALHVSPILFPPLFYLSAYLLLFWSMRVLALRSSLNIWIIAMLVCPATLAFQVLHPAAGFRKEILTIAALSFFLVLMTRRRISPAFAIVYMTVFTIVGTFSHEASFLYTPYFAAGLLLGGRTPAQAAREVAIPFVAGCVVFILCVTHIGDLQTAVEICSSLGHRLVLAKDNQICAEGAIPYLRKSRAEAGAEALRYIENSHYLEIYPAFAVLALIPAVGESLLVSRSGFRRDIRIVWIFAGLALICSLVLFRYGYDWGRWIYTHLMCITLLSLFIESRHREEILAVSSLQKTPNGARQLFYSALVFLYAVSWILPNAGEEIRIGYLGKLVYLIHSSSHNGKGALAGPAADQGR